MHKQVFITILLTSFIFSSCKKKEANIKIVSKVYQDTIFTKMFDMRDPGFTGGDATYSVELPDKRNIWIFGDTFIGEVSEDNTREKTNPMYIRNCFVVQNEYKMETLHQGSPEEFISMAVPKEVENGKKSELDIWFWPGDGFVNDNKLNVFMSKFYQAEDGMWGFKFLETVLVEYSLPDLKELKKIEIPYSKNTDVHFGHAIYEADEFIYIYGLKEQKPYVARAKYKNIVGEWEFYSRNNTWSLDSSELIPMADIDGSEQFSIIKLKDKYVLITQLGSLSTKVCSFISDKPYGPWTNQQLLFETPVTYQNNELFTYNALAHPQFTNNDNELLISYNTNSMKLEDHFKNAGIYKPRFMRVPINLIFNK